MTQFDQRNQRVNTQYNAGRDINVYQHPLSLTEQQRKRNRTVMLKLVEAIWIDGVLEPSLRDSTRIALALQNKPSLITNPWKIVLQEFDRTRPLSPTDASILQVYDRARGEVLLLGEAGSGKTTLLLELARELLKRAHQGEDQPIPVIFTLSSWTPAQQLLSRWLALELHEKYQIPYSLATFWIETDQVLPLLDGLDEVAMHHRAACVDAINIYRRDHGLLPTVVCSREQAYIALSTPLQLRTAVVVQPLTSQQVESYLSRAGEQLGVLHQALQEDVELQAMASTPLMLNVLTIAYQGISPGEIAVPHLSSIKQDKQKQVFAIYVQRMLTHQGVRARYTPEQTIYWLSWLAKQLSRRSETVFYIERMQPAWLPGRWPHWLYHALAIKLVDALLGLLVGLVVSVLLNIIQDLFVQKTYHFGAATYCLIGLVGSMLIFRTKDDIQPAKAGVQSSWRFVKIVSLGIGAIVGLIIGLGDEISVMRDIRAVGLPDVLTTILMGALIGLVVGALMSVRKIDIQPCEIIVWSRRKFFKMIHLRDGIFTGFGIGLINGLIILPVYGLSGGLVSGLLFGLFATVQIWLVSGLADGLSSNILDDRSRLKPNEGIQRSARNGIQVALVIGPAIGLIMGIVIGVILWRLQNPIYGPVAGIFYGTASGLAAGLISGLLCGGDAYIKHLVLRLLLHITKSMPWNYPRFLDHATEHALLRKVGGGYIFVHHLLLEYFVASRESDV